MAGEPLVKVINLRMYFTFKRGLFAKPLYVHAVDDVTLDFYRGETVAVVGESGCGKTTLGKTIIRLYEPTGGKIIFEGKDITHLNEKELRPYRRMMQIIHQDPFSSLAPHMTIYKILEEPLIINKIGKSPEERAEMIFKALEDVKLTPPEEFAAKYPHMLSGGQRQRVAIARAMILKPKFIVADEPVSMLDASVRVEILYLMRELQEKYKTTFMYITHDLATTKYFSERIAVMYAGKIVELGETREVLKNPLHPYTQALIEAIPDPDPQNRFRMRKTLPGEPPSLVNPPPGCRLAPRCPFATDICRKKVPPMVEVKQNHFVACWLYVKK